MSKLIDRLIQEQILDFNVENNNPKELIIVSYLDPKFILEFKDDICRLKFYVASHIKKYNKLISIVKIQEYKIQDQNILLNNNHSSTKFFLSDQLQKTISYFRLLNSKIN